MKLHFDLMSSSDSATHFLYSSDCINVSHCEYIVVSPGYPGTLEILVSVSRSDFTQESISGKFS